MPSSGKFDVNGWHILSSSQTVYVEEATVNGVLQVTTDPKIAAKLSLGNLVDVYGKKDGHTHSIEAKKIVLKPSSDQMSGYAVIQRVIPMPKQTILEADGYKLAITSNTTIQAKPPLPDHALPVPGMWISYTGKWDKTGVIVVKHGAYSSFVLSKHQKKVDKNFDGKFVAPDYETKKDGEVEIPYIVMAGHKAKGRIPADQALQQRMQKIGDRLVPTYQKALAKDDPLKIDFRFFAIDNKGLHQAIGSPDGLVILSTQMVNRLQSDDRIAALLAYGIAQAIERQVLTATNRRAAGGALMALGGIATVSAGLYELHKAGELSQQQSERVSLSLMHDAGFDVSQAPVAWQILASKDGKNNANAATSDVSTYLLSIIGLEYSHDPAVATAGL